MSETHAETPPESAAETTAAPSGVADVDAVVASLDQLDELPVDEHVAVFERAHESLRAALDSAR